MLGMDEARTGEDPFEFSQSDSESAIAAAAATDKGGSEPAWSAEEAMIFEQALQQIDCEDEERWEQLAARFPNKSVDDMKNRISFLLPLLSSWSRGKEGEAQGEAGAAAGTHGLPWSQEEHMRFLAGLAKYGKGQWRRISRLVVHTRTPAQVASHAQKYFYRQQRTGATAQQKSRRSIHDMTIPGGGGRTPSEEAGNSEQGLEQPGSSDPSLFDEVEEYVSPAHAELKPRGQALWEDFPTLDRVQQDMPASTSHGPLSTPHGPLSTSHGPHQPFAPPSHIPPHFHGMEGASFGAGLEEGAMCHAPAHAQSGWLQYQGPEVQTGQGQGLEGWSAYPGGRMPGSAGGNFASQPEHDPRAPYPDAPSPGAGLHALYPPPSHPPSHRPAPDPPHPATAPHTSNPRLHAQAPGNQPHSFPGHSQALGSYYPADNRPGGPQLSQTGTGPPQAGRASLSETSARIGQGQPGHVGREQLAQTQPFVSTQSLDSGSGSGSGSGLGSGSGSGSMLPGQSLSQPPAPSIVARGLLARGAAGGRGPPQSNSGLAEGPRGRKRGRPPGAVRGA